MTSCLVVRSISSMRAGSSARFFARMPRGRARAGRAPLLPSPRTPRARPRARRRSGARGTRARRSRRACSGGSRRPSTTGRARVHARRPPPSAAGFLPIRGPPAAGSRPPVDRERGAADVPGVVAQEERDDAGGRGQRDPSGGVGLRHRGAVRGRVHRARQDGVHAHAVLEHLGGDRLGERDDGRLGSRVRRGARARPRVHRAGADDHDAAPCARDHRRQKAPEAPVHGLEVALIRARHRSWSSAPPRAAGCPPRQPPATSAAAEGAPRARARCAAIARSSAASSRCRRPRRTPRRASPRAAPGAPSRPRRRRARRVSPRSTSARATSAPRAPAAPVTSDSRRRDGPLSAHAASSRISSSWARSLPRARSSICRTRSLLTPSRVAELLQRPRLVASSGARAR